MKAPMLDVIEIENQYYVRAESSLADTRTNVLMAGDTFAVFDRQGNFRTIAIQEWWDAELSARLSVLLEFLIQSRVAQDQPESAERWCWAF